MEFIKNHFSFVRPILSFILFVKCPLLCLINSNSFSDLKCVSYYLILSSVRGCVNPGRVLGSKSLHVLIIVSVRIYSYSWIVKRTWYYPLDELFVKTYFSSLGACLFIKPLLTFFISFNSNIPKT